jgi:hypothetical protein
LPFSRADSAALCADFLADSLMIAERVSASCSARWAAISGVSGALEGRDAASSPTGSRSSAIVESTRTVSNSAGNVRSIACGANCWSSR